MIELNSVNRWWKNIKCSRRLFLYSSGIPLFIKINKMFEHFSFQPLFLLFFSPLILFRRGNTKQNFFLKKYIYILEISKSSISHRICRYCWSNNKCIDQCNKWRIFSNCKQKDRRTRCRERYNEETAFKNQSSSKYFSTCKINGKYFQGGVHLILCFVFSFMFYPLFFCCCCNARTRAYKERFF